MAAKKTKIPDDIDTPVPVETQTRRVPDVIWQALIAGVFGLAMVWLQNRQAINVEQVKIDLLKANAEVLRLNKESDKKLNDISGAVEEVHKATNGMKHELVEEVRKASFAAGKKSEADKQDTEGVKSGQKEGSEGG